MKNINHFLLALAATLSVTANAQTESDAMQPEVVDPVVQVETTTTSKPYMHILLPANSFVPDGFELEKYGNADYGLPFQVYLQRESVVSYEGGETVDFFCSVENVVNKETSDVENLKVTYLFDDRYYALEGSKIKVSLPKVSYKVDEEVKDLEDISFTWTVSDLFVLDHDAKYSELADKLANATSVVVKAPYCLTIDGSDISTLNQLIVEGGANEEELAAGVVINEGATLNITDTAYYLCKETSNRQMGYLINRGAYTATSSIFTKYVPHGVNAAYTSEKETSRYSCVYFLSCPVNETSLNWAFQKDFDLRLSPDDGYDYNTTLWDLSIQALWVEKDSNIGYIDLIWKPGTYSNYTERNQKHRFVRSPDQPVVLRLLGDINDDSQYELPLFLDTISNTIPYVYIDNYYQSPIDYRSIVDKDPVFAAEARSMHGQGIYGNKTGYDYNFKTGLTTFDGPMYYGYLAPPSSSVAFYNAIISDNSKCVQSKEDVISYREAKEKYEGKKLSDFPYVRFYVDDPENPKLKGERNVFVAYFMPYLSNGDDGYMNVEASDADGYDEMYKMNLNWNVPIHQENSHSAFVPIPPYIGAENYFYRDPACIKNFPKPTVDSVEVHGENIFIVAQNGCKQVTLGVLDYDLDNICVKLGGLVVNSPNASDTLETKLVFEGNDAVASDYNFLMHKTGPKSNYTAQLLKVTLNRFAYVKPDEPDPDEPLGVEDIDLFSAHVTGGNGFIVVTSSMPSVVSVLDLTGRAIVPSLNCISSLNISLTSGIYIVNINSSIGIITKKVLVK